MMRQWKVKVVAPAMSVALGLVAWGASTAGAEAAASVRQTHTAKAKVQLTVGTLPVVDEVPVWLGAERGFFARQGLDVSYKVLTGGGPAVVKALQSGSVQFADYSCAILMVAATHGVPLTSVAEITKFPQVRSPEGIFVKASSPIHTIAQLKGATIGVNSLTSLESVRLQTEVLPPAHLTASDVHLVPVPFPQMQEALSRGEVQAVIPFAPFTTRLLQSKGFRELTNLHKDVPKGGLCLAVSTALSTYAHSHAKVVKEFQAGLSQSLAYIKAHPTQAAAVAAKVLKLPASISLAALRDEAYIPGGKQELATYQNMVKALQSAKLVPSGYNVRADLTG